MAFVIQVLRCNILTLLSSQRIYKFKQVKGFTLRIHFLTHHFITHLRLRIFIKEKNISRRIEHFLNKIICLYRIALTALRYEALNGISICICICLYLPYKVFKKNKGHCGNFSFFLKSMAGGALRH